MARTADVIQREIDELRSAIGSGVLTVSYPDRSTTFRSMSEMRQALQFLLGELADATGTSRVKQVYFQTSKGL